MRKTVANECNLVPAEPVKYARLYEEPLPATRVGPIYNAFSYPTKIDAEAIALFIAAHTEPGALVLDPFAGSGSTGIAARLCDRPTQRMLALANQMGLRVTWGPRDCVLYELSPIAALLASVVCDPPAPKEFELAAHALVDLAEAEFGWAYEADNPLGGPGSVRHIVWSEILETPCCSYETSYFDAAVQFEPVVFRTEFECPNCRRPVKVSECNRVTESMLDPVLGHEVLGRKRVPARVYGRSGRKTWSRMPTADDLRILAKVDTAPIGTVPRGKIFWGDLWRSGYHTGIEEYCQLYTPRNLRAFGTLWDAVESAPPPLHDPLRLLLLSYNASHSTLLTRVVAKQNQNDLVVTGAQSGVLYVSALPVEKNLFAGVRRKIATFADAFSQTADSRSQVRVVCGSSLTLDLDDASVDYVFTDPPFGGFIPYAEVNQINEAWLGRFTDRTEEAIVSPAQGKDVVDYARMISSVFGELSRVVTPEARLTVVFHASKPEVWGAIGDSFARNGFEVEEASMLDKKQVSFKQVVSEGGTRGDALFLLRPGERCDLERVETRSDEEIVEDALTATLREGTSVDVRHAYSRYVGACLENGRVVAMGASEF
ncbi:MAG: DNA methylase, partial [Armatimonadetes bacterium]|nr:DNA methylase [Armatimonadota bacterium]